MRIKEASYLGAVAVGTTRTSTEEEEVDDRVVRGLHIDYHCNDDDLA